MSRLNTPIWPSRSEIKSKLTDRLISFDANVIKIPGAAKQSARDTLVMQMIASIRRIEYTSKILKRPSSSNQSDPKNELFDPEKAAIFFLNSNQIDESVWLIFLSIHFGKHPIHGWRTLKDVYSGLGAQTWSWRRVSQSPTAFRTWLGLNNTKIGGGFGSHRKYESLNADLDNGTGATIESYVKWIGPSRSHSQHFSNLIRVAGNDPASIFEYFYKHMDVRRFGRLGKFDFLCMLGRLGLIPATPGRTHLSGATGPLRGARLLFGGDPNASLSINLLEQNLIKLDTDIEVGAQVLEDSLCNWQKSPNQFVHFRG